MATVDSDATHDVGAVVPVFYVEQCVAVNDFEIFNLQPVNGIDVVDNLVVGFL